MDSDHRLTRAARALFVLCVGLFLVACAPATRPFALRPPLERDTDLLAVSVPCHLAPTPKDPKHVSCAPRPYASPLAWDAMDNSIFGPVSDALAVHKTTEARNANSLDEVADSAWFTNRIGARDFSLAELSRGACLPSQLIDPAGAAPGSWVVDKGKANGSSLGFRVVIPGKGKYMFKVDDAGAPEHASAASVIGAAAYYAAGFNTSCEQVIYFDPALLNLAPGLHYEDNSGRERDFDKAAFDRVLAAATKRGLLVGPFSYEGTRDDDPNDAIAHENRRELRGGRLLAAWLDHFDAREQNTMDTWISDRTDAPDASPGYVRHYYLDMSDCLGSEWAWDGISRRLGRSYLLDWADVSRDFVTLGVMTRPWERVERAAGHEKFGYFDVATFDPEGWKNEYPNPAFKRMTERDGAWMARILARFTPEMVRTLAELGQLSAAGDTNYLTGVLEARLQKILDRYLTRLSPLADVHLEDGASLCATDLSSKRHVRDATSFHYAAQTSDGASLTATPRADGTVCVSLPAPSATSPRHFTVSISNGVASGALVVHLYDLGRERGYQVAGLDRAGP
jgi:hypothetical protein